MAAIAPLSTPPAELRQQGLERGLVHPRAWQQGSQCLKGGRSQGALTEEWVGEVRSLHEVEYYSALGRKEGRKEGRSDIRAPQVTPENVMLRGIGQGREDKRTTALMWSV